MPAPDYALDAVQANVPAPLDVWHTASAAPLTITYAFEDQPSADFLHAYTGWTGWTDAQKDGVRWALHEYESVINVHFVEVAGAASNPVIAFGRVNVTTTAETWWGLSYSLDGAGQVTAKRWDSGTVFDDDIDLANPSARWLILHEIGHAMMMKHTGNYDSTGAATPLPYLPEAEDNRDYTVMSYVLADNAAVARQLQLYDIAALQARWGANTHEASGDNVYGFADDPGIFAIWDTGGIDLIDAAAAAAPVDIDLTEGAFSQLAGQNRMSIAWGARIENANGGAFADRLDGNGLDNRLMAGAGDDTIEGGAGLDYLRGEDGDDVIFGGADFDDVHGNKGNDTEYGGLGDDWVVGGQNDDQLFGEDGGDVVLGNLGLDTLDGGAGADIVRGGQGDDIVRGGAGADFVSGDRGDDTLTGGAGADSFHIFDGAGVDRVTDFSAADGDRVQLLPDAVWTVQQEGADTVVITGDARLVLVGVQMSSLPGGWIV